MVERLNGEPSDEEEDDEDDDDSDAAAADDDASSNVAINCTVHSSTARGSSTHPHRRVYTRRII